MIERFGIADAQSAEGVFAGLEIRLSLVARGLGLLEVGLGDGAVREEVLSAGEKFFRKKIGIAGFEVGGAGGRVVWAGDGEERLAGVDGLAGRDEKFMDGAADGGENRRSLERVVGHGASEPQRREGERTFRRRLLERAPIGRAEQ